jgi:hypothetical protein
MRAFAFYIDQYILLRSEVKFVVMFMCSSAGYALSV